MATARFTRARARALSHTQTQTHLPLARASLPPAPFLFDTAACFDRALALGRALSARAALRRRPHTRARSHSYPSLPSPSFCRRTVPLSCFKCDAPTPPTPPHPTHPRAGALKPAETEAIAGWLKDRHDKALYAGSAIKRSNNKVRLYTHSTSIRGECKV